MSARQLRPWGGDVAATASPHRAAVIKLIAATSLILLLAVVIPASSRAAETPPPRNLVIGGAISTSLAVMNVDRAGNLTVANGSPFSTGFGAFSVAITPDGRTVYVANAGGFSVTAYRLEPSGRLIKIGTTKIGLPAAGLAVTPDGKRVFVTAASILGQIKSYNISATGTLSPSGAPSTPVMGFSPISLPAMTPDGRFLYVASYLTSRVYGFSVASNARLKPVNNMASGALPVSPVVTPDGKRLYVSNEGTNDASGFEIASNGRISKLPDSPYATGAFPHAVTITSDGTRAYVPNLFGSSISGYKIAADGSWSPLPGSPYAGPGRGALPGRGVLTPDGKTYILVEVGSLSASIFTSSVHTYHVESDGRLTYSGNKPLATKTLFSDGPSSVITPNQGPVAAIAATGPAVGLSRSFSAQGSSDSDGSVASYTWSFGDGTTQTTTSPTVSHTYGSTGSKTVTVTVVDDEGCSLNRIYNGQVVTCNGGAAARASLGISVTN